MRTVREPFVSTDERVRKVTYESSSDLSVLRKYFWRTTAADCVCGSEEGRSRTEGLSPLDAPRPRFARARSQRADPPGSGNTRSCLGFDYRPVPACAADGIVVVISGVLAASVQKFTLRTRIWASL